MQGTVVFVAQGNVPDLAVCVCGTDLREVSNKSGPRLRSRPGVCIADHPVAELFHSVLLLHHWQREFIAGQWTHWQTTSRTSCVLWSQQYWKGEGGGWGKSTEHLN